MVRPGNLWKMSNIWNKILLKLVSGAESGRDAPVDGAFWRCSRCDGALTGSVFMAHDRSYCSEVCRVLAIAPREVVQKIECVLNETKQPPSPPVTHPL